MHEYSAILGPVDSAFYYVDRPETPMNIGALTLFDGIIDFDTLVSHIDTRLHQIPRYRDRVIQAPMNLGQPTWISDPDFYIGNHVKRVRVDPPATQVELRRLTGQLLSRMLDRSRPLWEIHVIEGLPNQTAIFFKVHHCMVDGLAAVELFTFLMDVLPGTPEALRPREHKPLFDPQTLPDPLELTRDSLIRDLGHQFGLLQKLGKETLRMAKALSDREQRLKMLLAVAHLINDNLRPIKKLPINGRNSGMQQMVWVEFPLDEIHFIRSQCGASVNDVMLAILSKAVERYSAARGCTDQPFLRLLVPFNMREETEKGDYGNRISVLPIDVPFNVPDPLEHLKAVTRFSKAMKESSLAYSMDLVLTLPALLPAVTHSPIWQLAPVAFSLLAHTWCTNVAAMPLPVYLLGHELKHVYGYFPLNPSMGLAAVVVSYNGQITMSLMADYAIVPDVDVLERALKEAFLDLASGLPGRKATVPVENGGGGSAYPIPRTISQPEPASQNGHSAEPAVQPEMPEVVQPVTSAAVAVESAVTEPEKIGAEATRLPEAIPAEAVATEAVVSAEIAAGEPAPAADSFAVDAVGTAEVTAPASADAETPAVAVAAVATASLSAPVQVTDPMQRTAPIMARQRPKLFSEDWAKALQEEINRSEAYRSVSLNWTAGSLAFVMETAPAHGFEVAAAVWLDLYRGVCRSARAVTVQEATHDTTFVIQGAYPAWMDLLAGRAAPLMMLTNGRLKLRKGALHRLLPYTRSAAELVHCAQRVPWE